MGTAVLNVIAVIGLVAVAAFIIVFLADLLISVIDGKNGIFFKRKSSDSKEEVKTLEMKDELDEAPKLLEQKQEEPAKLEGDVDMELAESERLALTQANQKMALENEDLKQRISALEAKQVEEEPVEEEKELTDEELDKMYADLIADINRDIDEEEDEEELLPTNDDVEELEEPEEEPAEVEEVEQPEVDEEKEALAKQVEELKKQLEQEQQEKQDLAKQLEEKPVAETVEVLEGDTLESLLAQKAQLEERLKDANKELKANKKEYIPLARIKKTLENDEAKLRRREAIVAKKKIVLFGVTNYVTDPEKEKEISEDLDQLEALRLSVQHCEEVMEENKDRYPLLENTNAILKTTVAHIKEDIEVVDQKIAKLQGTSDAGLPDNE